VQPRLEEAGVVAVVCGSRDAESHVETCWRLRLATVVPDYYFIAWYMPDCCLCNIKKNALDLERFPLRPANSVLMLPAGDRQRSLSLVDTQVSSAPNFGSNATSVVRYCCTNHNKGTQFRRARLQQSQLWGACAF
jgi:hypothetical protein